MNYNEKYQKWVSKEDLDPTLKAELLSMDETAKEDAFYTDVEFGTAGMRGILGAGTNRLNIYVIQKANVGFAKYIASLPEGKERGVAIGYDNRHMSYKFAIESAKVLATYGIKSYIFESLRPTPELSFAVRYLKCAGGIMITASHNPKEHNGYKVYDDTGCQLLPEAADQVVQYVNEVEDELNIKVFSDEEAYPYMTWIGEEVAEAYYKEVMAIEVNPGMDKSDFKIVFSPQHGTSNIAVRTCLTRLGYDLVPVLAQCAPDPDFSNTKSPNPEVPASYELAIKKAKEVDADVFCLQETKMQETQFENAEFRCFFRLRFRPHQWEHHRVADIPRAEQNLQNAVNAHAPAGNGRHAVFHRRQIVVIHHHSFLVAVRVALRLNLQSAALLIGVHKLRVRVDDLRAVDDKLKAVRNLRIIIIRARQRRQVRRVRNEKRRRDHLRAAHLLV